MAKPNVTDITVASISVEQILKLGESYRAQELRGMQSKLTSTAKELQQLTGGNGLLGRIGGQLNREQQQLLRDAASLIQSINYQVEHAKEKRQRTEKQAKARREERDRQAKRLVADAYPLPITKPEHRAEIIRLALVLNRAGEFFPFYSDIELNQKLRAFVAEAQTTTNRHRDTLEARLTSKTSYFRTEIIFSLEKHIAYNDGTTVQARFDALQHKLAELGPQVLDTQPAAGTVRLWMNALSQAEKQEGQA
ncbi:hypothetical protein ACE0DR_22705 [Azotobacter sp. CWF10]